MMSEVELYMSGFNDGAKTILDMVKIEIEELEEGISSYHNDRPWIFKDEVLQIIDKYMGERKNKQMNVSYDEFVKMNITKIMRAIHEQGVEDEVFELLTQWMIRDRNDKMEKISESEAIIRAINKIATRNKNLEQAIDGIVHLSESED